MSNNQITLVQQQTITSDKPNKATCVGAKGQGEALTP